VCVVCVCSLSVHVCVYLSVRIFEWTRAHLQRVHLEFFIKFGHGIWAESFAVVVLLAAASTQTPLDRGGIKEGTPQHSVHEIFRGEVTLRCVST